MPAVPFQRRIATLPGAVYFVVVLAVTAGMGWTVEWALAVDGSPVGRVLLLWLSPVLAVGGTVYLVARRRRLRAEGRFEQHVLANEAMRTGQVPRAPAVRAELNWLLPSRQRAVSRPVQWSLLPSGFLALTQVFIALGQPRHWVLAAFFAVVGAAGAISTPRQRRRLADLEHRLRAGG